MGGDNADAGQSIIRTSDGGYAVLAATESIGAGGIDYWLIKIDKKEKVEWEKTYGGTQNDMPNSIVQTADG